MTAIGRRRVHVCLRVLAAVLPVAALRRITGRRLRCGAIQIASRLGPRTKPSGATSVPLVKLVDWLHDELRATEP